uniref:Vacuolar protein sorting-associated protein 37C n=1 Tax=Parasteatoda tepidariorum TaxID=114398 RepID=A0A2L2YMB3_PARTP
MNSAMFTPDYSHLTGLLQQLNDEELKELLQNEGKLKNLVNDLKQVQDLEAEKEMLLASTKSISEYNLSRKPILDQHRLQVVETHEIALDLKNSFLEKKKKIESSEKAVSKDTLLALLEAATSEIDEEAEASVEFFLKNEISVEDFLEKYLELRKHAHLRRIKTDKLANIIRGDEGRNISPPIRPHKTRTAPSPPLPYPNANTQSNSPYGPVRTAPPVPSRPYQYPGNVYPPQPTAQPYQPFSYMPSPYPGYSNPPPANLYSQYK